MNYPLAPFPIVMVPDDNVAVLENLGTKEKFWIEHEGQYALLKFGRQGTGEDWAEKIASELCGLLGLPHAQYDFAECKGRQCVITPSLVEPGGRLVLGNELINYVSTNYDGTRAYQQREHTVSRVLASLKVHTQEHYQKAWHDFIGYLMLDAWIGNTDRHHENWGLVRAPGQRACLAPTFDHASSMGRELDDVARLRRLSGQDPRVTVAKYAEKARSALYSEPTDKKPLTTRQAFFLTAHAQSESRLFWLQKLKGVTDEQVSGIIGRIPSQCMSVPARDFTMAVLAANKSALVSVLGNQT